MSTRVPIRLLMVEDDTDDYVLTRDLLAESSTNLFQVTRVAALADGLRQLAGGSFDIVLLDLSLPDSQGLGTFTAVARQARDVPVILLTGLSDEDLGVRAVQEGAQDYLVKGQLDGHVLVRAIVYAIERKRTKQQLERYAEELRVKNQQMAEDLVLAREIQQAFLPSSYPVFPPTALPAASRIRFCHHYRPSALVGGDFLAIMALDDHTAGIFICDVMGHGMRAALVTAILRGLLEEMKPSAHRPGLLLSKLNQGFMTTLTPLDQVLFASALHLVLDADARRIEYAAAGHPSPLLMDQAAGCVRPLPPELPADPALGFAADHVYRTVAHPLAAGDRVLLFTDGLFEARNPAGEEFGLPRLASAALARRSLATPPLVEGIVEEVRLFAHPHEFDDDICLVAAELRG